MAMDLCRFRDIFGKPGEGAHAYRFLGYAAVDVMLTVLLAVVLSWFVGFSLSTLIVGLVFAFGIGVLAHWLFCVRTTLNVQLGLIE